MARLGGGSARLDQNLLLRQGALAVDGSGAHLARRIIGAIPMFALAARFQGSRFWLYACAATVSCARYRTTRTMVRRVLPGSANQLHRSKFDRRSQGVADSDHTYRRPYFVPYRFTRRRNHHQLTPDRHRQSRRQHAAHDREHPGWCAGTRDHFLRRQPSRRTAGAAGRKPWRRWPRGSPGGTTYDREPHWRHYPLHRPAGACR